MRNLKRALSLALAAIMLLGMMVVGASAVSYNDFSDRTEIVNKDAVSMLTTLGVIDGKPDGSYAPTEFVTREQMAKMISVIMNQGSDNNDLFVGVPSGLTDVAGNWALGHINYCYSLGIIAGRGDGRFDPTANVTASEAAKMLLVAAGYNPSTEGFVGADWAVNVNAKASALGIFRNYTKSTMADLNRDDAALLIYNALDIEMIQKYEDGYAINFNDRRTILSAMYGVYKIEGVVVANQWAELDGSKSEDAAKAGTTILDDVRQLASTTNSTDKTASIAYGDGIKFNVDTTEAMMGKRVTLFIEKTTILSDSKVLGVALKDDVNVVMTNDATVDTAKDYLKGTGLAVTADTEFYVNYGYYKTEAEALAAINDHFDPKTTGKFGLNGITMEVIDHDNDGDVDYVLYKQETLSKVSRYSEKNETVSFYAPTYASDTGKLDGKSKNVSVDFEDAVFNDDVTTDDLILYIQYGGRTYISLPEIVTGVMSRIDRDKNNELFITVEGDEYRQSYILDAASLIDVDVEHFDIEDAKAEIGFSSKWDFILDSTGKYVVAYRPAEESITNYALVIGSAWTQNALDVKGQVKILKTDGTEGTYYINWDNSAKAFDADGKVTTDGKQALERYLGTRDVQTTDNNLGSAIGTVITYSLSDDDILTIKNVFNLNTLDAKGDFTDDGVDDFDQPIAYVGANPKATATPDPVASAAPNLQYTLNQDYKNGDGYVSVTAPKNSTNPNNANTNDESKVYAIDKNTVAFYYKDGDHYGVATGWDHMSDVDAATKVQVYPVMKKDTDKTWKATNLAELVLFNAEPKNNTANWLLVLTANAVTSKVLELNVVFEDGTTKAIEVSRSKYDAEFDKADGYAYNVAYAYSVNSDGTYELNLKSRTPATTAELLKNGTLDLGKVDNKYLTDSNGVRTYPTLLDKSNVWDVTDMNKAGEDAPKGSFIVGEKKNAVIIANNDNKILQTAWIWDYDEKTDETEDPNYEYSKVFEYYPNNLLVQYYGPTPSGREISELVRKELNDSDIESVTSSNNGVTVEYKDGSKVSYAVKLDRTYAVTLKVNGPVDGKGYVEINGNKYYDGTNKVLYLGDYQLTREGTSAGNPVASAGTIDEGTNGSYGFSAGTTGITDSTGTLNVAAVTANGTLTVTFYASSESPDKITDDLLSKDKELTGALPVLKDGYAVMNTIDAEFGTPHVLKLKTSYVENGGLRIDGIAQVVANETLTIKSTGKLTILELKLLGNLKIENHSTFDFRAIDAATNAEIVFGDDIKFIFKSNIYIDMENGVATDKTTGTEFEFDATGGLNAALLAINPPDGDGTYGVWAPVS